MAESTLAVTFPQLRARTGSYLGYGRGVEYGEPDWTTMQLNTINECVASGLRKFYYPAEPYSWSFLTPETSVTLIAGENTVDLPEGFNGFVGNIRVTQANAALAVYDLRVSNDGDVLAHHARDPQSSGRPWLAAEYKGDETSSEYGQRFKLLVYPTPDAAYSCSFNYRLLPDELTELLPYHYGGAAHAETVIEACLAAAEQARDDELGTHTAIFRERMAASLTIDKARRPAHLGYNRDRSDGDLGMERFRHWGRRVTYNGTLWE